MIHDCVMLFNELDLLELRFSELEAVVDRFVVAEAPVTHAGRPKRLAFSENRQRFARWSDRVVHVIVEDMPKGPDPWSRERHQRNALIRGLRDVAPTDGVIISDVNEIPKPAAIQQWSPNMGLRGFEQLSCYYWINCVGGLWAGSRILRKEQLQQYGTPTTIRHAQCPLLIEGGWHFSFLGGAPQITAKLEAYAHQDLNIPRYKDQRYLDQVISTGMDLFGRPGMHFSFWPLDERFPACVLANRSKYGHLIREAKFVRRRHFDGLSRQAGLKWWSGASGPRNTAGLAADSQSLALEKKVIGLRRLSMKLAIVMPVVLQTEALLAVTQEAVSHLGSQQTTSCAQKQYKPSQSREVLLNVHI
jgi:beta-1,4-mannosyl-glycoprotein beta-1,4-N-acetylglucosaminyltransferase